jgi:hypothetical protein
VRTHGNVWKEKMHKKLDKDKEIERSYGKHAIKLMRGVISQEAVISLAIHIQDTTIEILWRAILIYVSVRTFLQN